MDWCLTNRELGMEKQQTPPMQQAQITAPSCARFKLIKMSVSNSGLEGIGRAEWVDGATLKLTTLAASKLSLFLNVVFYWQNYFVLMYTHFNRFFPSNTSKASIVTFEWTS